MIAQHANRISSSRRLWSGYVRRLFRTLDLDEHSAAPEISESLAVFCEQHPHMPAHSLSLVMARTFCAAGDHAAADRILRHDRAHRTHAESWLTALSAEYPFPELYPLFSSQALRPLRLKTAGGGESTWVLDLERVVLSEADRHEMILLQTLRVLTEKVSNVWKKTDGNGTLVVKGLPRLTAFVQPRTGRALPQMIHYLQDVLQRSADRHGWSSVPSVLLLDL
jgi:hypothetical protein